MISKMQNKNLPEDERLSVTPDVAELLFTTDDKKLYVGDGTTHGGILISDNAFITEDMTLNVPADYADINEALDFLSAFRIKDNATVTIQVADGTYEYSTEIFIDHPDAKSLQIIGNPVYHNQCIIWNSTSDFVFRVNRGQLGLISGFFISGVNPQSSDNPSPTVYRRGLGVHSGSVVKAGNIEISKCYCGVEVAYNSEFVVDNLGIKDCVGSGILVNINSMFYISQSCNIASNADGVYIGANSSFFADESGPTPQNAMLIQYNRISGLTCINNGFASLNYANLLYNQGPYTLYTANDGFIQANGTTY